MKQLALSIVAVAILLVPVFSHAFEAGFARISMIEGEALIKTEESTEWLPAAVNTPLYEGDSIWSPEGSRVEIQLLNNTHVRLDGRSSVDILALDKDVQQFHLGMGHIYVRTGKMKDNALQVDVNETSLKVYDKARFRVDIAEEGDEEVALFKGNAYAEGRWGSTRLRTGEMLAVEGNRSELAPLDSPDEWEQWNRDRDRRLAERKVGSRYLPEELTVYSSDLDANGEWIEVQEYGHVWRPTVIVTEEWSPYSDGRWVWRGGDYVWVSYESWGWAPYHYGRWVVLPGRGWCWVPPARSDVFWGPGYVGWVTTPAYVGWVPLAPGEVYYGRGHYGRHSVNITNVNINTVNKTNVTNVTNVTNINNITYKNVTVNNAVTVVKKDAFVAGKVERIKVRENIFAQKNAAIGIRPAVKPAAREALMPVVKTVSPAELPPAKLVNVPVRELRERHPRLMERHAAVSPVQEKARRGPERRKPQDERGSGRQKPVAKKEAQPSPEGSVKQNGRPTLPQERLAAAPPTREGVRRDVGNGKSQVQRETPLPRGESRQGSRPEQTVRPGEEKPEPKPQGEGKARKARKIKGEEQKERKEPDEDKEKRDKKNDR